MDWTSIMKHIMRILPVKVIVDVFLDWLKDVAEKTENKLDDSAVEILQLILYSAFGWAR